MSNETLSPTECWEFVSKAFDGQTTCQSERTLELLGITAEDSHMPLEYYIKRELEKRRG